MAGYYKEWYQVCVEYARHIEAELLFVNANSFGICTKDGKLLHIYADELAEILQRMNERGELK